MAETTTTTDPQAGSETAWPPPWTLKPADGDPHDSEDDTGSEGIGWDLSFGFRLNFSHNDPDDVASPLVIDANFSDADKARGFVQREVTPEQLDELARLLLNLSAKHKRRRTAAGSGN